MTNDFIDTMCSMSLYPKITRPSRITSHGATLIDKIFTNDTENSTVSRLLINDISDHLPVFTVYDRNYSIYRPDKTKEYRRMRTEETINTFKIDLLTQKWDVTYQIKDTNSAYEEFLRIFTSLYNENCPQTQYSRKLKYAKCPWIKGLQNVCKKKKCTVQRFLKTKQKKLRITGQ